MSQQSSEDEVVAEPETLELLNEAAEEEEGAIDIAPSTKEKSGDAEGEEEEPVDELKEIEEELEGPKEEDLELTTPVRRREILEKYPKLFKDFPYLEKAYYREQQFTELLPTIDDARQAVEKSKVLDGLEREVIGNGNLSLILGAVKEDAPETFNKIADNYLPALRQVDQNAYYHVLSNVIKDTIITMVRESRSLGEQGAPLQAAANILNQFVFGTNTFTPPQTLAKNIRPEENQQLSEIQQREQQLVYRQFEGTRDELQTKADNVLKATIEQNIDPRGSMTEYVKKNASKDAMESLESLIARDTRFRSILDKLWEKAFQNGFDKSSTDKIKSAYLSKAKTLLPSVIKQARNNALRGRARDTEEENEPRKAPITPGKSTSPSSGKIRKASDIPKGMSTLDVLMKD